jgi:hypothetical protein
MLGGVESYLARFQVEGLPAFRLEPYRSLQHVDGLIAGMEVSASDGAGRKIGDEDDDFLSLHSRDRFPQ